MKVRVSASLWVLLGCSTALSAVVVEELDTRERSRPAFYADSMQELLYSDENVTIHAINVRLVWQHTSEDTVFLHKYLVRARDADHFAIVRPDEETDIIGGREPDQVLFRYDFLDGPLPPWTTIDLRPVHQTGAVNSSFWRPLMEAGRVRAPFHEPALPVRGWVMDDSFDLVWWYTNGTVSEVSYATRRSGDTPQHVGQFVSPLAGNVERNARLVRATHREQVEILRATELALLAGVGGAAGVLFWQLSRDRVGVRRPIGTADLLILAARGTEFLRSLRYVAWFAGAMTAVFLFHVVQKLDAAQKEWMRVRSGPPIASGAGHMDWLLWSGVAGVTLAWLVISGLLEWEYRRWKTNQARAPTLG